ncbi:hypothetical protein PISMIDRAFT_115339, partial [Pisolithus microcarpus 441]
TFSSIKFHGTYTIPVDPMMCEKDRVQSTALEVWRTTGYCFRVLHHYPLQTGHKTLYCCCQDKDKKQKPRPSQKEGVKHRNRIGQHTMSIKMRHLEAHVPYYDVTMPPDAIQIIRDGLEWSAPSALVPKIRTLYPHLTASQVHFAWTKMSEILWKKETNQLTSARLLLEECHDVEVLDVTTLDGIEQLCWGIAAVAHQLSGKVVEIALDATCKKRTKALQNWATCLQEKYHLIPRFVHVDKDMAEISMAQSVWPDTKIQICWWHLQKALRERLAKSKLTTTPYKPLHACHEFTFININFRPPGTPDPSEFEGGVLLEADKVPYDDNIVPSLSIRIPAIPPSNPMPIRNDTSTHKPLTIKIKLPTGQPDDESVPAHLRSFCPTHLHDTVVQMVEQHLCAHPLIPGYCYPSPAGIRQWAVKQMYMFCEENDLPELWAYLWENWYRRGRWELWAHTAAPGEIPRLKTTMVMESHWRHVKVDYLYHFSKPRVDLLVWILVKKLAPTYHIKLDHLLSDTGRFRELSSWRKKFKSEWKQASMTSITLPLNPKYRPDTHKWHLVQSMHPVSPIFFLEVQRSRTTPFWSHPALVPLDGDSLLSSESLQPEVEGIESGSIGERETSEVEEDKEPDGNMVDTAATAKIDRRTFKEHFSHLIANLRDFTSGLEYQIQFGDHRMLNTVEREGANFIRLMENCLERERRENSARVRSPTTWEKTTANVMFYRSRPPGPEHGT